jgi:hypothetical protein
MYAMNPTFWEESDEGNDPQPEEPPRGSTEVRAGKGVLR